MADEQKEAAPASAEANKIDLNSFNDNELMERQKQEDIEFMKGYSDVTFEDLVGLGYVTHTVSFPSDKKAVIRSLTDREDKDLAILLGEYRGSQALVVAENGDDVLARSLVSFSGIEFGNIFINDKEKYKAGIVKAKEFIERQSVAVKMMLIQEYQSLNKAVAILLKGPGPSNPLIRPLSGIVRV